MRTKRIIPLAALAIAAGALVAYDSLSAADPAAPADPQPGTREALEATAGGPRIDSFAIERIDPFTRTVDGVQAVYDRQLVIHGSGFYGTSQGPFVHLDGEEAWGVEVPDGSRVAVYLPAHRSGPATVRVTNPDGRHAERATVL